MMSLVMNSRKRVLNAIDRGRVDRVPIDIGTIVSGITTIAYQKLIDYLGIKSEIISNVRRTQLASIDPQILDRFHADTIALSLTPPGMEDISGDPPPSYIDSWGVTWARAREGQYYATQSPFSLNSNVADIKAHVWPSPPDSALLSQLRLRATEMRSETDLAIILALPGRVLSIGERLMGFEDWHVSSIMKPELSQEILVRAVDAELQIIQGLLEAVGGLVDVVYCPDDLGAQDKPLISPKMYRELIKPHHARLVETIKGLTSARVVLHSDGAIFPLLDDIIEVGFDAINPVQVSAKGMDTGALMSAYGNQISFWGGVDTQFVLPFGSPEEVREEVRKRICDLGEGGGYVLAPVHNIQPEVPPENIVAMYEAAYEFGRSFT
jgi:uroporphyrinogen decarboxylase